MRFDSIKCWKFSIQPCRPNCVGNCVTLPLFLLFFKILKDQIFKKKLKTLKKLFASLE